MAVPNDCPTLRCERKQLPFGKARFRFVAQSDILPPLGELVGSFPHPL